MYTDRRRELPGSEVADRTHGSAVLDVTAIDAVVREQSQHGIVGLRVAARVHVHRVTLDTCTHRRRYNTDTEIEIDD